MEAENSEVRSRRWGIATWCFANPLVALPDSQKAVLSDARWGGQPCGEVPWGGCWRTTQRIQQPNGRDGNQIDGVNVDVFCWWLMMRLDRDVLLNGKLFIILYSCWLSNAQKLKLIVKDLETHSKLQWWFDVTRQEHLDMVDLWKFDLGILLVEYK